MALFGSCTFKTSELSLEKNWILDQSYITHDKSEIKILFRVLLVNLIGKEYQEFDDFERESTSSGTGR